MTGYGVEPVTLKLRVEREQRYEELERVNMENEDKDLKRHLSRKLLMERLTEALQTRMEEVLVKNFPVGVRQGGAEGDLFHIEMSVIDAQHHRVQPFIGATVVRKMVVTNTNSPHAGKDGLIKGGPDKAHFYRVRFTGDRADHNFKSLSLYPMEASKKEQVAALVKADVEAMYVSQDERDAKKKIEKKRRKEEKMRKRQERRGKRR
jgi:hypothetical protein